ncbi:unnamed protein product [Arctogadus glacialis]
MFYVDKPFSGSRKIEVTALTLYMRKGNKHHVGMHDIGMVLLICYEVVLTLQMTKKKNATLLLLNVIVNSQSTE